MKAFTATEIRRLKALDEKLRARGLRGEVCLYGGAVMVLVWQTRNATKDIDAVFVPPAEVRAAAAEVAKERGVPSTWLNDGVKGFLSERAERLAPPQIVMDFPNLTVKAAAPRYLLAMKVMAARVGEAQEDAADAAFLIEKLGLTTAQEVFDIVEDFYPRRRIPPKTQFFVEEMIEDIRARRRNGDEAER